jgi:citrate lyase beta subunit
LLITPGHRADRLAKAAVLPADALAFDLEDGVPPARKAEARTLIATALRTLEFGNRERIVRINGIDSPELDSDLQALPLDHLDALLVPKVESAAQLHALDARLAALEARAAASGIVRSTPLRLIVTLETPRGVLRALEIAEASPRCTALFFGSGDYTMQTGGALTPTSLHFARSMLVAAAAAVGVDAIDAPYLLDLRDPNGNRTDAMLSRELGFAGKVVFHPLQIDVVNAVYTPDAREVARARRLLAAFGAARAAGEGTALVDGEFVAIDLMPRLERLIAVAEYSARQAAAHQKHRDT